MNRIITFYCTLTAMSLLPAQPCLGGSFFKMALARNSIYTPGGMHLTLNLTNKVRIESECRFRVHVYVAGTLVRKHVLTATKTEPVVFELSFPRMQGKTDVRCRAELLINGEFVEARESPLTLWPSREPYPKKQKDKTIWVFDTSGRLQRILDNLEVETVDAIFQSARNFGMPDIVFIGEDIDPNSLRVLSDRLAMARNKPLTIFLKQKQLPQESNVEIPEVNSCLQSIECDFGNRLLSGLGIRDMMNLVDDTTHVRIKKDEGRFIDSHVTEATQDNKHVYSYLCTLEEKGQVTIYCQLCVTDDKDPRCGILLNNLLEFADRIAGSQEETD